MKKNIKKLAMIIAVVAGASLMPLSAFASTDTKTTTINALIGSTISVGTSTTVNISVTPVTGGSQSAAADTVTVATNNATGYDLTLADSDANTSLVSGGNTIAAHAGTYAAPSALANNSWGYHIDGLGSFGTGGTAENNVTSSSVKYAGVPANGSAQNIKTSSTTASGDSVTVYYGVKADPSVPNGTYTDTVTYTATTK